MARKDNYAIRYAERGGRTKRVRVAADAVWHEARALARLHGWAQIERGKLVIGKIGGAA